MKKRLNIALLCGGVSAEREVSLAGAAEVEKAFDSSRYNVRRYDTKSDLARLVEESGEIDVAFILLHGRFGEDGTVQGLLELLQIPYPGAGVTGSAIAMSKHISKILYRNAGIKTPEYQMIEKGRVIDTGALVMKTGLPVMVKPCTQGSSVGMSLVNNEDDLEDAINEALKWDNQVLVEAVIKGREITVGILEDMDSGIPEPLPVVEIVPGEQYSFFDYEAKYVKGATKEICPADIPDDIAGKAAEYAVLAHNALGLRDYSRTDMIISDDDNLYVIETNTIPGMTPTSLLPQAAQEAGISFAALLDRLVSLAMRRAV